MKLSSLSLLAVAQVCAAVVIEEVHTLPAGWHRVEGKDSDDEPLRFSIALRQPGMKELEARMALKRCGQGGRSQRRTDCGHLTREDTQELQQADQEDVFQVLEWLSQHGINDAQPEDDFIRVRATVQQTNKLLGAEIHYYAFEDDEPVRRTRKYSVPDSMTDAVEFVHPIANFMIPRAELSTMSPETRSDANTLDSRAENKCETVTTPSCIRNLYGLPTEKQAAAASSKSKVRFGIAGFLEQNANYQDILSFLNRSAPAIAKTGYNFTTRLVNGAKNVQNLREAGGEAALDMQYALALGYPSEVTYYLTGGRGTQLNDSGSPLPENMVDNEPYLEFLEYLLKMDDSQIPHVLSFSYADDELSVPKPYAERVCSKLGLLTSRGTTILVGSGDGGARGARNSSCLAHDGSDRRVAMATFPGTCPWVTSIGATTNQVPLQGAAFSGGGFSSYFALPKWQSNVVRKYANGAGSGLKGLFDDTKRATPDISTIGTNFQVQVAIQYVRVQGTSASTPTFASLITLVNEQRLKKGKGPVGWLNEALYSEKGRAAIEDVKNGTSYSCVFKKDGKNEEPGGWKAAEGWDAITGLGVPKSLEKLMDLLMDA